ncbi:MAG: hypothetical protein ACRD21_04085 [Vicinamibacteria bacterium]
MTRVGLREVDLPDFGEASGEPSIGAAIYQVLSPRRVMTVARE